MKNLTLLILATIGILLTDCEEDSKPNEWQQLPIPDGWQQVPISNIIPDDCDCDTTIIKELSDYVSIVIGNIDSTYLNQDNTNAIIIDTISKTCTLLSKHGIMIGTAKICNYPEEMNN